MGLAVQADDRRHRHLHRSALVAVVFLCTGNAARSVMAGAALQALGGARVVTAGTFVVEGQPMSWRTRQSLADHGLAAPEHRSRQLRQHHLDDADLVVGLAVEHIEYVRREHPDAAHKSATLRRLCRDLPPGAGPLGQRVAALDLARVVLEPWEDVVDPGGGEIEDFHACAADVVPLVRRLHGLLAGF